MYRHWTTAEDRLFRKYGNKEIAKRTGRPITSVQSRKQKLRSLGVVLPYLVKVRRAAYRHGRAAALGLRILCGGIWGRSIGHGRPNVRLFQGTYAGFQHSEPAQSIGVFLHVGRPSSQVKTTREQRRRDQ